MKNARKSLRLSLLMGSVVVLTLSSCKKDEDLVTVPPPDQNEGELITTMKVMFEDVSQVQPTTSATFQDLDGDGGNSPGIFEDIELAPNTTYTASILLLNETESPTDTISNEVLEEASDHLFCFAPSGANVTITRTDTDGVYEVGLESEWTTGAVSTGSTRITLKHQPDVKDGTCAPGETDVEINFVTKIQ